MVIISSGMLGSATVDGGLVVSGSGSGHAQNLTTSLQDIFDVAMMIFKGAIPDDQELMKSGLVDNNFLGFVSIGTRLCL